MADDFDARIMYDWSNGLVGIIDGYASDGSGVARLEGMVVFVQGGIRGEVWPF